MVAHPYDRNCQLWIFQTGLYKNMPFGLPLEDGGDDRDDRCRGDESEGKLYDPLGRLSVVCKFFVKFLGVGDGLFGLGSEFFYIRSHGLYVSR
jgi:hypothetical protein